MSVDLVIETMSNFTDEEFNGKLEVFNNQCCDYTRAREAAEHSTQVDDRQAKEAVRDAAADVLKAEYEHFFNRSNDNWRQVSDTQKRVLVDLFHATLN